MSSNWGRVEQQMERKERWRADRARDIWIYAPCAMPGGLPASVSRCQHQAGASPGGKRDRCTKRGLEEAHLGNHWVHSPPLAAACPLLQTGREARAGIRRKCNTSGAAGSTCPLPPAPLDPSLAYQLAVGALIIVGASPESPGHHGARRPCFRA